MALLKFETDDFYQKKFSKQNKHQIFPLCTQEVKSVNYSRESYFFKLENLKFF